MRLVKSLSLLAMLWVALMAPGRVAWAQAALDDEGEPKRTTDAAVSPDTLEMPEPGLEYGVGVRLRRVYVPKALLELFVLRAPDGAANTGLGVEFVRRRGNLELQLGFEFENVQPGAGVWINKGDNVAGGDEADYILSPERAGKSLGWFTIEFTFLNHAPINKYVAVRYGGGAGIGIVTGGLQKYDVECRGATNDNPEPGCVPMQEGGTGIGRGPADYDLPPVFPVVNAIVGLQIRPVEKMTINIETGIRTMPFIGVSGGYFF
jgi:hypothetical protein